MSTLEQLQSSDNKSEHPRIMVYVVSSQEPQIKRQTHFLFLMFKNWSKTMLLVLSIWSKWAEIWPFSLSSINFFCIFLLVLRGTWRALNLAVRPHPDAEVERFILFTEPSKLYEIKPNLNSNTNKTNKRLTLLKNTVTETKQSK